jgi:hypothetical protein
MSLIIGKPGARHLLREVMVVLRVLAIASNLAFIAYGYCAGLWPILALRTAMLPLNLMRLSEAAATVSSRPDQSANIAFGGHPFGMAFAACGATHLVAAASASTIHQGQGAGDPGSWVRPGSSATRHSAEERRSPSMSSLDSCAFTHTARGRNRPHYF